MSVHIADPELHSGKPGHHGEGESAAGTTALDPVCGMSADPHATAHRAAHAGHPYFFCSAGCRTKFTADPALEPDVASADAPPNPELADFTRRFWIGLALKRVANGRMPQCCVR